MSSTLPVSTWKPSCHIFPFVKCCIFLLHKSYLWHLEWVLWVGTQTCLHSKKCGAFSLRTVGLWCPDFSWDLVPILQRLVLKRFLRICSSLTDCCLWSQVLLSYALMLFLIYLIFGLFEVIIISSFQI